MRLLALMLACTCALPAVAQTADSTAGLPPQIHRSDLNSSWYRLEVNTLAGAGALAQVPMFSFLAQAGAGPDTLPSDTAKGVRNVGNLFGTPAANETVYTRGQLVQYAGKTFLIAYCAPKQNMTELMDEKEPKQPSDTDTLNLTMLDYRLISGNPNVPGKRPAAAGLANQAMVGAILMPVFAQAREKARATSSLSNLKILALATVMFADDKHGTFPRMASRAATHNQLMPYVKDEKVFVNPQDEKPYLFNPSLSAKRAATVSDPAGIVLIYEQTPGRDGRRGVAFADGHAQRVDAATWAILKKRSHIP